MNKVISHAATLTMLLNAIFVLSCRKEQRTAQSGSGDAATASREAIPPAFIGTWVRTAKPDQVMPQALMKFGLEGGDPGGGVWNAKFTDTELELSLVFTGGNKGLKAICNFGHGWVKPEQVGPDTRVVWRYTYTCDSTCTPHTIDLTPKELGESNAPAFEGKPLKGLWKIEDGTLHLCYADADQPRPEKILGWDKPPLNTVAYLIFERKGGAPNPPQ